MNEYAIKIKQSPGWQDNPAAMISISVGHEGHEGAKLAALIDWGIGNYERCYLNVSDTLQRYNLMRDGLAAERAFTVARQNGDDWLARNADLLRRYEGQFTAIHRWNDWLYHDEFAKVHEAVQDFLVQHTDFRTACLADIQSFTNRKLKQGVADSDDDVFANSKAYLLEEIAAYIIMARTYAANRVYPAKPLQSFEFLRHNTDIPALLRGMERAMSVRVLFKRREATVPLRKAA